jgi:type III secretory pathway component EscT
VAELVRGFLSDPIWARRLGIGLLVALRLAPLTILAPWIALKQSPALLRAVLLLALTCALTPIADAHAPELPPDAGTFVLAGLREVIFGTMLAIASAVPLLAFEQSGRLIDALRGAQGDAVDASGGRSSQLGVFSMLLGTTLFLILGGHRLVLGALADGLMTAPAGAAAIDATSLTEIGRLLILSIELAVALAAPAAVALFASDVALGLISRSASNIPMYFAAMPLRSAVGLGAVLLSLSLLTPQLAELFRQAIDSMRQLST